MRREQPSGFHRAVATGELCIFHSMDCHPREDPALLGYLEEIELERRQSLSKATFQIIFYPGGHFILNSKEFFSCRRELSERTNA